MSKHENKFAKLQKEAAKYNFRNQLKTVKKQEYTLKEEDEGVRMLNGILLLNLLFFKSDTYFRGIINDARIFSYISGTCKSAIR